jgi:hypothetical protein
VSSEKENCTADQRVALWSLIENRLLQLLSVRHEKRGVRFLLLENLESAEQLIYRPMPNNDKEYLNTSWEQ